jgi:hypothetical protein
MHAHYATQVETLTSDETNCYGTDKSRAHPPVAGLPVRPVLNPLIWYGAPMDVLCVVHPLLTVFLTPFCTPDFSDVKKIASSNVQQLPVCVQDMQAFS